MKAEIINVGTELLLGETVNTNATFLAKELKLIGISVYHMSTIGDNQQRLKELLTSAFERSEIIITTGGLGPTKDDLTKETVAATLGVDMIFNDGELEKLKKIFKHREKDLNEGNLRQAYFPDGAKIINNNNGTASGCIIENGKNIIIVLPGPPREITPMVKETIIPYLEKFSDQKFVSKVINVCGIGESIMEERVMPLIKAQENPTLAPYFKETGLILRAMASAKDELTAKKMLAPFVKEVEKLLGDNIYAYGEDLTMESVVGRYLMENNLTISTAESCTGGLLSGALINIDGISKVFKTGFTTYTNESKTEFLGVEKALLDKYAAVSKQVAEAMAIGAAKVANTDIALSTTGIAGPTGGTKEKPVGLVYVGLYVKGKTYVKKLNLMGDRQKIRTRAVREALDFLRRTLNVPKYDFDEQA
ncbi:competence/damage-inducible protein A [Criibacterium bergeronii]|uniref:Putative competence-damage inducible protein n=1 Tax=Criibacterium bergeronii TaxID=1871336 RepID=A0A371INW4_9FIRM|nr:competence/damage-inducible protein A [Criibacterium bergeronii]MBS6062423.1 competence/damage-inducible protein A [Peptostreptococcaceae bacterium]RDY22173.1 competence/damage-inducible protein A [Criibacterium bergeronii]